MKTFVTCPRKIRQPKMETPSALSLLSPADSFSDADALWRSRKFRTTRAIGARNTLGEITMSTKVQPITSQPSTAGKVTTLTNEEILRYSRHLIMPEVGMEGQLKLKNAKVLLIGTGGLGAPLGLYLAAAGVGTIGLVDFDVVDFTNLQRQVIHGTKDVGRKKLDSAAETMLDINPHIEIDRYEAALTSENALQILKDYDIIIGGPDNFPP